MSRYGSNDGPIDGEKWEQNRITFEEFQKDPYGLLGQEDLRVKYMNKYLTLDEALPYIIALQAFGLPISISAEQKSRLSLSKQDKPENKSLWNFWRRTEKTPDKVSTPEPNPENLHGLKSESLCRTSLFDPKPVVDECTEEKEMQRRSTVDMTQVFVKDDMPTVQRSASDDQDIKDKLADDEVREITRTTEEREKWVKSLRLESDQLVSKKWQELLFQIEFYATVANFSGLR